LIFLIVKDVDEGALQFNELPKHQLILYNTFFT